VVAPRTAKDQTTMSDTLSSGACAAIAQISYSPKQAAIATGRSRARIFRAIQKREIVARKDGRATVITADELTRWVRSFPIRGEATATNEGAR
jgi:hypothetical protein